MEIKINKEIKEYNETMFFGLSVRQFIFAILACGAAVGIYFGCRSFWYPNKPPVLLGEPKTSEATIKRASYKQARNKKC